MRTTLLSLFLLLVLHQLMAQAPVFVPGKVVGVPVHFPYDIVLDADENIFLADAYSITKFDQEGNVDLTYKLNNLSWQNTRSFNLAIDQQNNLYLVSYTFSKIAKYSPEGRLLLEFGSPGSEPGQLQHPESVVVDEQGNIYVADTGNQRIQKFSATGELLLVIPVGSGNQNNGTDLLDIGGLLVDFKIKNAPKNLLYKPSSIVVSPSGIVYVSDTELHKILIFNTEGVYQREMQHSTGLGYLDGTKISLALDQAGNLFAADRRHHGDSHVLKFDPTGKVLNKWGDLYRAADFTTDEAGNGYLLDHNSNIIKFDPAGKPTILLWDSLSTYMLRAPKAIELDIQGNIYVLANTYPNPSVVKFSNTGRFLAKFQDFGTDTRDLNFTDLAIDAAGYIYLIAGYEGTVRKLSPAGVFLQKIGSYGSEPGQIWIAKAVSVDLLGNVFVLDYNGGRIQKFDPTGKFLLQFGKFSENDVS